MKREAKKILNFNCEWFAYGNDATGAGKGAWTAEAVLYDNNLFLGMATDANHNTRTHAIVGYYHKDYGVALFKLNIKNTSYDPIAFSCKKSNAGRDDTFYGLFTAITPINQYNLGYTKIKAEEKTLEQTKVSELENFVKAYESFVYGECYFQYRVFRNIAEASGEDFVCQLKSLYEKNLDMELPKVLREENVTDRSRKKDNE
jgi:hypothetical protein